MPIGNLYRNQKHIWIAVEKKIYQNLNTYCKNVEYVRLNTEFVVPDYWPQFNSCYLLKVTFVYVHVEYICNYPWKHWYLKWARFCKMLLVKMLRLGCKVLLVGRTIVSAWTIKNIATGDKANAIKPRLKCGYFKRFCANDSSDFFNCKFSITYFHFGGICVQYLLLLLWLLLKHLLKYSIE